MLVMMFAMADYHRGYTAKAANLQLDGDCADARPDGGLRHCGMRCRSSTSRPETRAWAAMWKEIAGASEDTELVERLGHIAALLFDAQLPVPIRSVAPSWRPSVYMGAPCGCRDATFWR